MYFENTRSASVQRANNAFLRRMLGGELSAGAVPTFNGEAPNLPEYPMNPPCNEGENVQGSGSGMGEGGAQHCVEMPSLAMVYAPRQSWDGVFRPEEALAHGTQFAALVLPFEGGGKSKGGKPHC